MNRIRGQLVRFLARALAGGLLAGSVLPARSRGAETPPPDRPTDASPTGNPEALAAPTWTDDARAAADLRRHGFRKGLGFPLAWDSNGQWSVETPNAAARAAGLQAGDGIERLLDRYLAGLDAERLDALLAGPLPDPLDMTILRPGEREPRTVRVPLSIAAIPPLGKTEMLPRQIGYLPLQGVWIRTPAEARRVVTGWIEAGIRDVVLDLRGADGDDAPAAADLAGWVLPAGAPLLVFHPLENLPESTLAAPAGGHPLPLRFAVLVDARTCGAAELLAALFQMSSAARVFGAATAGDPLTREWKTVGPDRNVHAVARRVRLAGQPPRPPLLRVEPDTPVNGETPGPRVLPEPVLLNPDRREAPGEAEARRLVNRTAGDPALTAATDYLLTRRALEDTPPIQDAP